MTNQYPPGGTPAGILPAPAPAPAPPTARPVISRGGYLICPICDLALMYCRGHAPPSPAAADGAESSLQRRIADARRDAGGR